jgi:AcrR family transcriptional regulator
MIDLALGELAQLDENGLPPDPETVLERFISLVSAEPAAARVCFVELHAAGTSGEEIADRAFKSLLRMVEDANSRQAAGERISAELIQVLIGGLGKVIHSRIYRGRAEELSNLAPGLWSWLTSVKPPPRPLGSPRRQRPGPGPRFEGYTASERIARAVATVMSEKGYRAMSTDDIAAQAAISLSTFYANFADKRDAVLAALEMSGAQIMALAGPAARRAGDWQQGVRALYEAMFSYFVAEPEMAQLATIGVYEAGPQALARRDRVIDSLTEMLAPGLEENPTASRVSPEAAAATVYALIRMQVRAKGPENLGSIVPLATYVTLVSFVGPERATAVANGELGRP